MDYNDKKRCLRKFENDCKKFKNKLIRRGILALNFEGENHDYGSELLDRSSANWKNFISEVSAYFGVNLNEKYQNAVYSLMFDSVGIIQLEELQHLFHEMIVDYDRESALRTNTMQNKENMVESKKFNNAVFIVHGHDVGLKNEVARFIEKQELKAIILHEQASMGKTIMEKIEEYSDVGFGIVLYTPDDYGKCSKEEKCNYRARQNVVLEHGYLMGKLGRDRVCAISKGDVEKPGDIGGMVYIDYDEAGGWKIGLTKEMRMAGYDVSF